MTQNEIKQILIEQKKAYEDGLEIIMTNKDAYISKSAVYDSRIYALEKMIKINLRAGNQYAVLRDEIQVHSFKILANQNKMMRAILNALDDTNSIEFGKKLSKFITQNILDNKQLLENDFSKLLNSKSSSKALVKARENIQDYYAIVEINNDVLNYLRISENKMYRLNKYSKYRLIGPVLRIQNSQLAKSADPFLQKYSLDTVRVLLIFIIVLIIYITRKFIYIIIERKIKKIKSEKQYAKQILNALRSPVERIILVFNINMIVYIFNDFTTLDMVSKFFNMLYSALFAIIVYKTLNAIAKIKVNSFETNNNKVKNDVVNVGIKIINFIVLIMGLLLVLHFAGANLTAILSGLGIGGLAVALAAKDSLANFFGTLSILFSDVLSQGDWIAVNGKEGVVVEIGTRVTTLRTFDNALVSIPNAILANQDVQNWNRRSLGRRIKMSLGIKYGASSQDIKNTVYEIREMLDQHNAIATENTQHTYNKKRSGTRLVSKDDAQGIKKTLLVYLDEFSDSSINILVYCFTKSVDWEDWLATKEDVMHKIMAIFEKNNLEFAFPSLSIYNEKTSE